MPSTDADTMNIPPKPASPTKTSSASGDVDRPWWARRPAWITAAAVLALVAVAYVGWRTLRTPEPPRMNEPAANIATFFDSAGYRQLPFDRQLAYLKQMDEKEDDLVAAYLSGNLKDTDYRKGLQAAYLGRNLDRAKKYAEHAPGKAREAYLDKLLDKRDAEKKGTATVKKDGTKKAAKPDARDAAEVKDIKRDDSEEAAMVARWPADVQEQWKQFHAAFEARKKARKEREAAAGGKSAPGVPVSPTTGASK